MAKKKIEAPPTSATAETMLPIDPECAAEPDLTEAEFASLVASIKARNGLIHPIVVWGDPPAIIAGRHRALASIEAGVPFGTYRVFIGDAAAKSAFIVADNDHRRHMSLGQRRDKATARLKANPEMSNRQIGLAVGLDDKTVASIRADLEARSEIPNVPTRTDTGGRQQASRRSRREGFSAEAWKMAWLENDARDQQAAADSRACEAELPPRPVKEPESKAPEPEPLKEPEAVKEPEPDEDEPRGRYKPKSANNLQLALDGYRPAISERMAPLKQKDRRWFVEQFEKMLGDIEHNLNRADAIRKGKLIIRESTIGDVVASAWSELQCLTEEIREAVENVSGTNLENTQRNQTLNETADSLENLSEPSVPAEIAEMKVTYDTAAKGASSRGGRASEIADMLRACQEATESVAKDFADEMESLIDEIEGLEFPGMY
jgi:ParB-like chromosome segregation protein Spo0J